jgi:AbrB family looped-hinge helix DNA binding protein
MVKHMSETLVVSSRGQITLPAALRKRLGIRSGDVVILEERGNEVVLKPGIVLEVQHYSDEQIAQWDTEDKLSDQDRTQIVGMLATAKK